MLRKPRYFYIIAGAWAKFGGAAILISPAPAAINGAQCVDVKVTFCSKDDQFCKKEARKALENKPSIRILVSHLPEFLWLQDCKVYGNNVKSYNKKRKRLEVNDFAWIWKYFL